jgi:hypothetical protein
MGTSVLQFASLSVILLLLGSSALPAQSYDAAWTLGGDGLLGYRLGSFDPIDIDVGVSGGGNPTLPLEVGRRYQLTVVDYPAHPLEVIAKGVSAAQDKVLLSMGSNVGMFASDPEVNWQDPGQGVVRFTLTGRLYDAMMKTGGTPGYRCRTQAATMRGDFIVASNPPLARHIARLSVVLN